MLRVFNPVLYCSVAFFVLAAHVELAQSPQSATVTGFVTQVKSPNRFEIGAFDVVLTEDAKCKAVIYRTRHFWFNPQLAPQLYGADAPSRKSEKRAAESILPCEHLNLVVGSWVSVDGIYNLSGILSAHSLAVYRRLDLDQIKDGAILEEDARLGKDHGAKADIWLNGYPFEVNGQTEIRTAREGVELEPTFHGPYSINIGHSWLSNEAQAASSEQLTAGHCATYRASTGPDSRFLAEQLLVWPCETDRKARRFSLSLRAKEVNAPGYQHARPGYIQLRGTSNPLVIIPNQSLQDYVTHVGMEVVPSYAKRQADAMSGSTVFRFYVVRTLGKMKLSFRPLEYGIGARRDYKSPVMPMPDGLIIIAADGGITSLNNEAQLSALLSIAVTEVLQRQGFIANQGHWNLASYDNDALSLLEEGQALRIGIRQMYLAGYDIREAPFSWLVAQGKPVNNPIIDSKDPDEEIPWYAAYAFDYISKYYSDVDYSKLKRGEQEYAQFLEELRKADPQAFEPSK